MILLAGIYYPEGYSSGYAGLGIVSENDIGARTKAMMPKCQIWNFYWVIRNPSSADVYK